VLKVYLAVPLVSNRSIDRARLMAKAISDSGNVVASPWNLDATEVSSPAAVNIFDRDRKGSENADVMVADVTSPSIGVGMEIMAAYKAGRRIILVSRKGNRISKMLEDMDRKERLEYREESEIYERLLGMLQ
jgi:nucleoside 2-deoxyribosyltransferase